MPSEIWTILINAVLAVIGTLGLILLNNLHGSIKNLAKKDEELMQLIMQHREDVLLNYIRHDTARGMMEDVKEQIIGRVDRFERTILKVMGKDSGD